jgi:hypothetical protein
MGVSLHRSGLAYDSRCGIFLFRPRPTEICSVPDMAVLNVCRHCIVSGTSYLMKPVLT